MSKYIFKILFGILFAYFSHLSVSAQIIQPKTDIFIIGTIHSGNTKITRDSVYNAITVYKPDIILWEVEPNYNPHWCLFMLGYKFNILKVPMEWLALFKIHRLNKNISILGFDSVGKPRNIFYKNYNKS